MMDTPQILLAHHLKTLKLPTFLREYDKVARLCAAEGVDFPRYLMRLAEIEMLIVIAAPSSAASAAKFPIVKSLDTFDFLAIPSLNKTLVLDLARWEYVDGARTSSPSATAAPARRISPSASAWPPARKACRSASSPRRRWSTNCSKPETKAAAAAPAEARRFELLIIDELGYVPLSTTGAELLFEVFPHATNAAPRWSPATCRSTNGQPCSAPNASPARCSTGSPTTSRSSR